MGLQPANEPGTNPTPGQWLQGSLPINRVHDVPVPVYYVAATFFLSDPFSPCPVTRAPPRGGGSQPPGSKLAGPYPGAPLSRDSSKALAAASLALLSVHSHALCGFTRPAARDGVTMRGSNGVDSKTHGSHKRYYSTVLCGV